MNLNSFKSFSPAFKLVYKDKTSLFLVFCPILIGFILYFFAGRAFFSYALDFGNQYIETYVKNETFGSVASFLVGSILSIIIVFIVNWTFVLIISLLASPFNDLLSTRIEKQFLNEELPGFKDSIKDASSHILSTLFNEIKKIALILIFTFIALVLSFIPFLLPISVFLTVLLLAAGYVDYSWSRHNLKFGMCFKDLLKNIIDYGVGGAFFMVIVSIPLINIFVPSLATSYFTILWVKNNEHSD